VPLLCRRMWLMPKRSFFWRSFGGKRDAVSWNELFELKRDFGISIAAIMARARNLGLITENYYIRFQCCVEQEGLAQPRTSRFPGQEQSKPIYINKKNAVSGGIQRTV